jgi:hypothetical protein
MSGAQAEFESAIGQAINGRRLPCELHRIAHVVVEHERAKPNRGGGRGHCREHGQRRGTRPNVIAGEHNVEAEFLGPPRRDQRIVFVNSCQLESDAHRVAHRSIDVLSTETPRGKAQRGNYRQQGHHDADSK